MAASRWRSVIPPPLAYWEMPTMSACGSKGSRPRSVRILLALSAMARVRSRRAARLGASHSATFSRAGAGTPCTVM